MTRFGIGFLVLFGASAAHAQSTDFGIRGVNGQRVVVQVGTSPKAGTRDSTAVQASVPSEGPAPAQTWTPISSGRTSLMSAASLGARWGRVTSTFRSVAHNRAVGGVPNSYHLLGRAIDIARRPGVTHSMIAAAYRSAGYRLVESLDEGDHSHFAFSFGAGSPASVAASRPSKPQGTNWGVVTVAAAILSSGTP